MADTYQGEISRLLHKYKIFTRHEKAIPLTNAGRITGWATPDRNSPDLVGGLVHQINVEVKTGSSSFSFDKITPGQYEYASRNRLERGCEFWFAIFFVTPYSIHGRLRRALYLVPYPVLIEAKNRLSGIQKSIPYKAQDNTNKKVIERGLVASELWQEFELEYNPQDKWYFKGNHPFVSMYLNQRPHLYQS